MRLSRFSSLRETFCTCPPKYNLNTYLGRCGHRCLYCYAVKFPSFNGPPRPRLNLLHLIADAAASTRPKLPVMLSDCTDPYQPLEARYKITRVCVDALVTQGFPLLIVTKSDLVVRDLDLLRKSRAVVAFTITTLRKDLASLVEPGAPTPSRRIAALKSVAESGVYTAARIDPLIPTFNDDLKEIRELVAALKDAGARHITVSTLKPVRGFFNRLERADRELADVLRRIYSAGELRLGYLYLPAPIRQRMVEEVRGVVLGYGLSFSSCREGLPHFNTSTCDGSSYCRPEYPLITR
ncbi:MAG: radical SAM protein [Candidatus Bathyarchaeia archaeon]